MKPHMGLSINKQTNKQIYFAKLYLPLEGLSEYLVQKTHAGHSCPLGPRTMPGGQSPSFPLSPPPPSLLPSASPFLDERSTGLPEAEEAEGEGKERLPLLLLLVPPPSDPLLRGDSTCSRLIESCPRRVRPGDGEEGDGEDEEGAGG